MDKKLLSLIMAGAGVLLIVISLILLIVSSGFMCDLEDTLSMAMSAELGYGGLDIDLDADAVRGVIGILDDMPAVLMDGMDVDTMFDQIGIGGVGFKLFALGARGWFFWLGLISLVAAVVVMALDTDDGLAGKFIELCKRFGNAVKAGFSGIIAAIDAKRNAAPRTARVSRTPRYACPGCGAPYTAGAAFCGSCGAKLPVEPGACGQCGTVNKHGARFCSGCGKPL